VPDNPLTGKPIIAPVRAPGHYVLSILNDKVQIFYICLAIIFMYSVAALTRCRRTTRSPYTTRTSSRTRERIADITLSPTNTKSVAPYVASDSLKAADAGGGDKKYSPSKYSLFSFFKLSLLAVFLALALTFTASVHQLKTAAAPDVLALYTAQPIINVAREIKRIIVYHKDFADSIGRVAPKAAADSVKSDFTKSVALKTADDSVKSDFTKSVALKTADDSVKSDFTKSVALKTADDSVQSAAPKTAAGTDKIAGGAESLTVAKAGWFTRNTPLHCQGLHAHRPGQVLARAPRRPG
jgi:hypothetical protein